MTPDETAVLVSDLRAAYREALVAQERRDAAFREHELAGRSVREAWDKVYRLQMQLQSGSEGGPN